MAAVLFILSPGVCTPGQERERRAYTVDDMLNIEGIGDAAFVLNGNSMLLEYLPPYEKRGQYGIDRGGQILQLQHIETKQFTPLFTHEQDAKYWLGDLSPDGRRLLVLQASRHRTRVGIFDFDTKELTFVDEPPQINERFELNEPLWINNHEIVFSSREQSWSEYGVRERVYVADRIADLRERAFGGLDSGAGVSTRPQERWFDGKLVRFNVDSKTSSTLAQGRFGDFKLSSDGRTLAALRIGPRQMQNSADRLTDYFRFRTELHIFDLDVNSSRSFLPDANVLIGSLRWSASKPKLSFFAWPRALTMKQGAHYVMESQSVAPVRTDELELTWLDFVPSGALTVPVAAEWLGSKLIVHGTLRVTSVGQMAERTLSVGPAESKEAKWYVVGAETTETEAVIRGGRQPHEAFRLSDGRLLLQSDYGFFIASDSDMPVALNIGVEGPIRILNGRWRDEIEDTIVFTAGTVENLSIGFFDVAGDRLASPLSSVEGRILAWAPRTQQFIGRADTENGGTVYLYGPEKGRSTLLTFNDHLSEVEHPRWRTIEYTGVDGVETFSCALLPYNYRPGNPYPTIVHIYPGTGKACKGESGIYKMPLGHAFWGLSTDVLSANGYLIIQPSNTYDLNQSDGTLFGGIEAQVDAALDASIRAGMTDPDRIGIWGFSNGSMASLWLASVSDRYKAVIPMFGGSSPHIEYFGGASPPAFQMDLGRPIVHLVQMESEAGMLPLSMGRPAITDPIAYIKSSPLDRVTSICSPVMMVHSDLDNSFTSFHYEALFSAMYRIGKSAELIRYYGEGHGLRSPGNIRDFYDRVLVFLDKYLGPRASESPCSTVMTP